MGDKLVTRALCRLAGSAFLAVALIVSTVLAWSATYSCSDRAGTEVYTDSPAQLGRCLPLTQHNAADMVDVSGPTSENSSITFPTSPTVDIGGKALGPSSPMIVPVQRLGQLLVVDAHLNGPDGPARLIVDTGASLTIISTRLARHLNIATGAPVETVTLKTAGGAVQASMAQLGSIRVGDAEVKNIWIAVHDLPDAVPGVDGLLGLTFLNRFLVTLDVHKGELSLRPRH